VKQLSTRREKISFEIKRFADFMKIFRRNKRGILGIGILVFFIVLAIAGPLIAPYDPLTIPTHPEVPLIAVKFAKPVWYKFLPTEETITENIDPIPDPDFNTATSSEQLEFTNNLTGQSFSPLKYVPDIGYTRKGCIAIVFNREASESPYGEVRASLTKVFNYPYTVPPKQFIGQAAMLVNTSEALPVKIDVIIEKDGGERRLDWFSQEFNSTATTWVTPTYPINSFGSPLWLEEKFGPEWKTNPAREMFSEQANYRYGIEITLIDTSPGEEVEATIYIDDFYFRAFGSSFGLLGTDQYGRDIFTQLIYGARISLIVGLLSAFFSTAIGLIVGLVAGYIGALVDQILMRFTDMLLVIPDTPLYIVLMAVLSPTIWNLVLLISLIGWTGFARVVRSQALSLKERPFIEAAKAVGAGRFRIIIRHILPNVMSLVYVSLATAVPYAIVSEAWLSWLGLYDPRMMTWGRMLHDVQSEPTGIKMWWWIVPPGLLIAAISLSFILLGYALDEILNPKLRERR
jgi:peptide/nickel transport system permease protein